MAVLKCPLQSAEVDLSPCASLSSGPRQLEGHTQPAFIPPESPTQTSSVTQYPPHDEQVLHSARGNRFVGSRNENELQSPYSASSTHYYVIILIFSLLLIWDMGYGTK